MEYGILVVAATEGVMPQTREHLILARQTNIKQLVVYVNKCDLVDEEMKSLVELEVQELLSQYEYDPDKVPIIFGSALASLTDKNPELGNESIQKLLDTIDNFEDPERIQDAPPVLAIENRYSIKGKGTVVTGKLVQGILKKGLDVTIQGNNQELKTQIVSIETFLKTVTEAHPGDILGVCIKGVKKDHVKRGMILSVPKYMHFGNHFKAKLYILSKQEASIEKPLLHETLLVVYYQTGHITSFVYLPGGENTFILQGDSGECDILMQKKTPMLIGSRFTLRTGSHTIGYGIVSEFKPDLDWFDVEKERKKRRKAEAKALAEEAQG
ncbi:MAG: hypothetical protein MHPSP_001843 [Paramarteilia canceri]